MDSRTKLEILKTDTIPDRYVKQGYHFCPDWNFDLIGGNDWQMEYCNCEEKERQNRYTKTDPDETQD